MIFTIYSTDSTVENSQLNLILQFLTVYNHKFIIHNDVKQMMILSMGKVNPNNGFVILIYGKICCNIFDVCRAFEEMGLVEV